MISLYARHVTECLFRILFTPRRAAPVGANALRVHLFVATQFIPSPCTVQDEVMEFLHEVSACKSGGCILVGYACV